MKQSPKVAVVGSECVACGLCENVCPREAVHVVAGIRAQVDPARCVGCGTCARNCPAAVISLVPRKGGA